MLPSVVMDPESVPCMHTFTHLHLRRQFSRASPSIKYMFLGAGVKPKNVEETHADTGLRMEQGIQEL